MLVIPECVSAILVLILKAHYVQIWEHMVKIRY